MARATRPSDAEAAAGSSLHRGRESYKERHPNVKRMLTVWLPVVAWAAVIFALSSVPSLSSGLGPWDTVLRKVAHVAEYAVLGALLYRALEREAPALAAGIAYAATDELHQHFVRGRQGSVVDVALDAIGVAVGMVVWLRLRDR